MSGIYYGNKYTYSKAHDGLKKIKKPGVYFLEKSKKWGVIVANKTCSKHLRPFILISQFDTEQEANEFLIKQEFKP